MSVVLNIVLQLDLAPQHLRDKLSELPKLFHCQLFCLVVELSQSKQGASNQSLIHEDMNQVVLVELKDEQVLEVALLFQAHLNEVLLHSKCLAQILQGVLDSLQAAVGVHVHIVISGLDLSDKPLSFLQQLVFLDASIPVEQDYCGKDSGGHDDHVLIHRLQNLCLQAGDEVVHDRLGYLDVLVVVGEQDLRNAVLIGVAGEEIVVKLLEGEWLAVLYRHFSTLFSIYNYLFHCFQKTFFTHCISL